MIQLVFFPFGFFKMRNQSYFLYRKTLFTMYTIKLTVFIDIDIKIKRFCQFVKRFIFNEASNVFHSGINNVIDSMLTCIVCMSISLLNLVDNM